MSFQVRMAGGPVQIVRESGELADGSGRRALALVLLHPLGHIIEHVAFEHWGALAVDPAFDYADPAGRLRWRFQHTKGDGSAIDPAFVYSVTRCADLPRGQSATLAESPSAGASDVAERRSEPVGAWARIALGFFRHRARARNPGPALQPFASQTL